ncbi:MAG TPA: hypothetical protein VMV94_01615 [Phycisphaerae bacterium]|nr:hypothetical protein [Phycisphaerae bacterium]
MPPPSGKNQSASLFLTLTIGLTLLLGLPLAFSVPTVQQLPEWFWILTDKPLTNLDTFLGAGVALLLATVFVARQAAARRRCCIGVCLLIAAGTAAQYGMALAEKRGFDSLKDRMITTGHAEFARTACMDLSPWWVLKHYEELVTHPGWQVICSKPPG